MTNDKNTIAHQSVDSIHKWFVMWGFGVYVVSGLTNKVFRVLFQKGMGIIARILQNLPETSPY